MANESDFGSLPGNPVGISPMVSIFHISIIGIYFAINVPLITTINSIGTGIRQNLANLGLQISLFKSKIKMVVTDIITAAQFTLPENIFWKISMWV